MSPNIDMLYRYFQNSNGNALAGYHLEELAALLGLDSIALSELSLSPLLRDSFQLRALLSHGGKHYRVTIVTSTNGERYHYAFWAVGDSGGQLLDLYDIPGARTADTFYGVRTAGWFSDILVEEHIVWADTSDGTAGLDLTLVFLDSCPLLQRYERLMPAPNTPVVFSGEVATPMAEGGEQILSLTGRYPTSESLPFAKVVPLREASLTIDNHVLDPLDMNNYPPDVNPPIYMTEVTWSGRVDLGYPGLEDIWLSFNLLSHAQLFDIGVAFGEDGLSVSNLARLMTMLSGINAMPELPKWLVLGNISLHGVTVRMRKDISGTELWFETGENGQGVLDGVSVTVGLPVPSIPIPFFDAGSDAKVTLQLQWDILSLFGDLSAVIAFKASWRQYMLLFNLSLPHWKVEARLSQKDAERALAEAGNTIFPGFLGLSVKDVGVYGDFPAESYSVGVALENESGISFPFIDNAFVITSAEGGFSYSTLGTEISLSLGFALFGADIYISGGYRSEGAQTRISLGGGLTEPLKLSTVLKEIFGLALPESLDLEISLLRLYYTALLDDGGGIADSRDRRFVFTCTVAFHWDILPESTLDVESSFMLDWSQKGEDTKTCLTIRGALTLMKFQVSASCELLPEQMKIDNYRFLLRLGNMSLEGTKAAGRKAVTVSLNNFNFGELLEALIGVIARDANWYLPWPFKVLKQLTLRSLTITFDSELGTVTAKYSPKLKILFFTLESVTMTYDQNGEESFVLNLELSGIPELPSDSGWGAANGFLPLDLLKGNFPPLSFLGKPFLELRYLGVGQHVKVELPSVVDGGTIPKVLAELKAKIKRDGTPTLDAENNWLAGLDICLLKSINIAILMCDPNFYGVRIGITGGSDVTKAFAGLELVVLYRKVSANVGVFQAHLALPEKYRQLELGAVSIRLGEIDLSIYTNGNFLIDLGFPHNRKFARSFGLAFGPFSGQGGLYLGVLNGQTSQRLPAVKRGSFGTTVELGLGVSAGIGREIRKGPLSAGAYVRVVGIFEGIFSSFTPPDGTGSFAFYRISATVGITARIYGEVDFVVISAGFSVDFSAYAALTLESYCAGKLELSVTLRVSAYVKVLFVKIHFSFSFTWKDSFTLGSGGRAPWDDYLLNAPVFTPKALRQFAAHWYDGPVLDAVQELQAEVVPYFSYDGADRRPKIGWLACLQGYQGETLNHLSYADSAADTPLPILVTAMLRRVLRSYGIAGTVDADTLEDLQGAFAQGGHEGFTLAHLGAFFGTNVIFRLIDSAQSGFGGELHGVPLPCPPTLMLTWKTGETEQSFDLAADPQVPEDFAEYVRAYFGEMSSVTVPKPPAQYASRAEEEILSASTVLFCDYFYMLAKIALAQAGTVVEAHGAMDAETLISAVIETSLDNISGQLSRFLLGGLRVPPDNADTPVSLYEFAHQQFDGAAAGSDPEAIAHCLTLTIPPSCSWVALGRRAAARDAVTGHVLLDIFSAEESLEITLKNKDISYPAGSVTLPAPILLPLFAMRDALVELKPPISLDSGALLFETQDFLPSSSYQALYYDGEGMEHVLPVRAVYVARIPLEHSQGERYAVGHIDRRSMGVLHQLRGMPGVRLTFYRGANEIDHSAETDAVPDETELVAVDMSGMFLYRSNLSLEAEKPEAARANSNPVHSAYADTQAVRFLSLLADACLVNARGYHLSCTLPGHAVAEGEVTLTMLVETDGVGGNAVILPNIFDSCAYKPVLRDGTQYAHPILPQGQIAFSLSQDEPGEDNPLGQNFNMLACSVRGGTGIRQSNESLPIPPQSDADGAVRRFAQTIPLSRFLSGDESDPYRGVAGKLSYNLDFTILDVLGNRAAAGAVLAGEYGYYDHLLSPAAYPDTQCLYHVRGAGAKVAVAVTFTYKEPAAPDGLGAEMDMAYHQLRQPDVTLEIRAFGQWCTADKEPLVAYLNALRTTGVAPDATITILTNTSVNIACAPIDVALRITRDEHLLVPSLQGVPEGESVRAVSCDILFDGAAESSLTLAKDADGSVYLLRRVEPSFSAPSYWAIPPLSTALLNLPDVPVTDLGGNDSTASFADVDPEIWMDTFLRDVEEALAPDSALADAADYQVHLEALLATKGELAESLASAVTHITHDTPAAQKAAQNTFEQAMRKNLLLGRRMDAVAVLKSSAVPERETYSYVGQIAVDGNAQASAGKIAADGLLSIPIRADDVSAQKELSLILTYTLTDWELREGEIYSYLSLFDAPQCHISMTVPLPFKRYPDRPELQAHAGLAAYRPPEPLLRAEDVPPEVLFAWNYEIRLAHKTAAQDTITVETVPVHTARERDAYDALWIALARYIYLRDAMLSDLAAHAERFAEAVREVAAALRVNRTVRVMDAALESITFELDRAGGRISLRDRQTRKIPALALSGLDGAYTELTYDAAHNAYLLPEDFSDTVLRYQISFKDYQIARENLMSARAAVTRNENIGGINPAFIYRTPHDTFPSHIKPSIRLDAPVDCGAWTRENFTAQIVRLWEQFGSVNIEAGYLRRMVSGLYALTPALYIPAVPVGETDALGRLYDEAEAWRQNHIAAAEGDFIGCNIAFFDVEDEYYNLAELANLRFSVATTPCGGFST